MNAPLYAPPCAMNRTLRNSPEVSAQYGVAAMVLGKGMFAIHQSGREYTEYNIDSLLMERHVSKKARKSGKIRGKGPSKRTIDDDKKFQEDLVRLIEKISLV